MKDIIIVGAGSAGVEIYAGILLNNKYEIERGREAKYNVIGFLDDNPNALQKYPFVKLKVIDNIANWKSIGDERYVLGVTAPKIKEKLVNTMTEKGCVFETVISPYSMISDFVKVGKGCVIYGNISAGAQIGDYVTIMGTMIGGDSIIGDYSTTLGLANIANGKLGKRVYVGSHAVVLNVPVGDDAVVSVGSIVVSKVKAGTKVFGSPATRIDF